MSKHTPGPWKAQLYEGSRFDGLPYAQWEIFADDQPGTYVASANEDNDDAEANASLIAAAPELLEALESVLDSLGALTKRHELLDWMSEEEADSVFAAIAKARGDA